MKHIIILSGHSKRFLEKGYTIKPLIKILNKTIIEYVVDTLNLSNFADTTFIIKSQDVLDYKLDIFLKERFIGSNIAIINGHTLGPVYSILQANCINEDCELLVTYCDLYIKWDINKFFNYIKKTKPDGCIVSHSGWHPHRIYNQYFAYLRTSNENVLEVKEKKHFTEEPINEFASGGIYYFKTGKIAKFYFEKLITDNICVNNEFYVTLPYNLMISDGLKVTHFDSRNYVCLGTPKDVEIFSSAMTLFSNLENNEDISNTLHYFKKYIFI